MSIQSLDEMIRARARKRFEAHIGSVVEQMINALEALGVNDYESIYVDYSYCLGSEYKTGKTSINVKTVFAKLREKIIAARAASTEQKAVDEFLVEHARMRDAIKDLGGNVEGEE